MIKIQCIHVRVFQRMNKRYKIGGMGNRDRDDHISPHTYIKFSKNKERLKERK